MIGIPYSRIIKYQKNTMARHVLWLLFGIVMRVVTSHRAYTFSIFVLKIVADEMAQIHKTMCSIYKIQRFSVKKEEKKKRDQQRRKMRTQIVLDKCKTHLVGWILSFSYGPCHRQEINTKIRCVSDEWEGEREGERKSESECECILMFYNNTGLRGH